MRDYSKIAPTFWIGQTGSRIKEGGPETVIVALYLLTSPHANMLGLYYCPVAYIMADTGLTLQGASKGLQRATEAGFCAFDAPSGVVWVYEMAKYQIDGALKPQDKRVVGVRKEYAKLQKSPFLGPFYDKYKALFHLDKRRSFEGPSEPHRSQEQEQEQEQDIDTSLRSVSCPEVPSTTGPAPVVIMSFPLLRGEQLDVTKQDVDQWQETYPAVDVPGELRRCLQWNIDNPKRRKTKTGIRNHISTWLAKVQDRGGSSPHRAAGGGSGRPPVRSVRDAMILQGEEIARALNEDDERRKQVGPEQRETSGVLLEHPVQGDWVCQ